jgi:alpha-L-rhamnosidase
MSIPMVYKTQQQWLETGEALTPMIERWTVAPSGEVEIVADARAFQGWRARPIRSGLGERGTEHLLRAGKGVTLDFGEHLVGELSLEVESSGSAVLQVTTAEAPAELMDPIERYPGKLQANWQEGPVGVEPGWQTVKLPRRKALRYARIDVIESAGPVRLVDVQLRACSAAGALLPAMSANGDRQLHDMDVVAMRTLRNCMQEVFEDGPKRDRRLWLGDLRLQALAAYETVGGHDLVRRCLYLLAGCARPDGFVPACVFAKPEWHHGNEFIPDYAMLLAPTVLDHARASDDWTTARNLWPLIRRQADLPAMMMDGEGLVRDRGDRWIFIDWCEVLDREAALQGVFIYGLARTLELGRYLGVAAAELAPIRLAHQQLLQSSQSLWDARLGCFVSGPKRQVSWASQVWMILADAIERPRAQCAMRQVVASADAIGPQTPYLYHHVVQALWRCGLIDEARQTLRSYWGGMLDRGATTFWEVFDASDDRRSPYGSHLLNSYCHAWSCTPSWFIRRGLFDDAAPTRAAIATATVAQQP